MRRREKMRTTRLGTAMAMETGMEMEMGMGMVMETEMVMGTETGMAMEMDASGSEPKFLRDLRTSSWSWTRREAWQRRSWMATGTQTPMIR